MQFDPQTQEIERICRSLIGSKTIISYRTIKSDGEIISGELDNTNIVGDSMENILYECIHKQIPSFEKGPKQASPDFYNSKIWEWELKCFTGSPNFDISNLNRYI